MEKERLPSQMLCLRLRAFPARPLAAAILIGALAAAGCGGGEAGRPLERPGGEEAQVRVGPAGQPVDTTLIRRQAQQLEADIEDRLDGYGAVEGRGKAGDRTFTYTAYFDGDDLLLIREHQDSGDYGHSDNDYYYDDGKLTYFVQGQISRVLNAGGPPTFNAIVVRLYFGPDDRMVHAVRTLGGMPVPLEGYEELSVRRRSAALREAALAGGGEQHIAIAEPVGPITVEFDRGRAAYQGRIVAREIRNYVVHGKKDQQLSVELEAESRYVQFVVQFVGQSVYDSRRSGRRDWSDKLPRDGEYTVRVYLSRGEADRGGAADYELKIGLAGGPEPRS